MTAPPSSPRILYVNNQLRLGGAETVVGQLLRGFPQARLAVADGQRFPAGVALLYPRLFARLWHSRFHRLMEAAAPRDRWTDRAFRRLAKTPCDLIHLHNFHGRYASLEALAEVARLRPLVWTFHALWGVTGGCDHPRDCRGYLNACGACPQLGRWPLGAEDHTAAELERKMALLGELPLHVIAPSRWLAEIVHASRVGRRWRIHHIPNAVNGEFLEALPSAPIAERGDEPIVLVVNRNFRDEQKGFLMIREALSLLPAAARPARVILVGENSDWAAEQLSFLRCEARGYVGDSAALAALHARANLFLFASPAENFPCAVLEAMAAGACVVATPSGGVVEQVEHGVSGLLAEAISGEALAAPLAEAIGAPALRRRLGAAARERVLAGFTEERFWSAHARVYRELLEGWEARG
jgi:glycosyltransferase involved in cell wall biosynthesis